ncbi:MAG: AAA family ATPase, partial [Phycisphaerae bacterium]
AAAPSPSDDRMAECLREMLAIRRDDKFDGSLRLYACCCRCVEWDLPDAQALTCIRTYAAQRPFPRHWTDTEIVKRLRAAENKVQRGAALHRTLDSAGGRPTASQRADGDSRGAHAPQVAEPDYKSVRELLVAYPQLRRPLIHGLLREGETANIIAPPKTGKSWLVTDLALSVATGRPWLGTFQTVQGNVLIVDNELHGETTANRIPKVAQARGVPLEQIADIVFVENLRGQLRDLIALGPYFEAIEPGTFKLVILDAFYRFIPRDTDENDNGSIAQLYNHLDHYAQRLGCSFVLIHHASKGSQSGKSVTDVGAGAGSQSRATDAHIILRAHEEDGAVVLDAAVRSWKPVEPMCLRWEFPVFHIAPDLDPTALRPERRRRKPKEKESAPPKPEWDVPTFVQQCITEEGRLKDVILDIAVKQGISKARAKSLLRLAEAEKRVHRWVNGANRPVRYAGSPQPLLEAPKGGRTRP